MEGYIVTLGNNNEIIIVPNDLVLTRTNDFVLPLVYNGTGITSFTVTVLQHTNIYTDYATLYTTSGRTSPSKTQTILSGATRTIYLDLTGGTSANITFTEGGRFLQKITYNSSAGQTQPLIYISTLPKIIDNFTVTGGVVTGDIVSLQNNKELVTFSTNSSLSGDINNISGCTKLQTFVVSGPITSITGSVDNLTGLKNMVSFTPGNINTLSGDIKVFSYWSGFTILNIAGSNTLSGDLISLSGKGLQQSVVGGFNTITGDIKYLSGQTITTIAGSIGGYNTIYGDITTISKNITSLNIAGYSNITGNLSGLTNKNKIITRNMLGRDNVINGSLLDLSGCTGMTQLALSGTGTITGNLIDLKTGGVTKITLLNLSCPNTVGGSLVDRPSTLTTLTCLGSNTITGRLSGLSSTVVWGNNTISGSISDLLTNVRVLDIQGNNTISGYTSGFAGWASSSISLVRIIPVAPGGLTSTMVDNLLIDLSSKGWVTAGTLTLTGSNQPRTSASDAAVSTLQGKGVTVTTN